MVDTILGRPSDGLGARLVVNTGERVAIMVNNLGATPALEMLIVARRVAQALEMRGVVLARAYVGNFMTSLEMGGVSVTVLKTSEEALSLLDDSTTASAWVPSATLDVTTGGEMAYDPGAQEEAVVGGGAVPGAATVLQAVCLKLISMEPQLTDYDTVCGDGDCGIVMKAGATGVLADMAKHTAAEGDAATFCSGVADSISNTMGGTSGALLELALRAMSSYFKSTGSVPGSADWGGGIVAGVQAMQFYGGATVGMRTMLDALVPAAEALAGGRSVHEVAEAAQAGAASTATMQSLAGRSNYIEATKMDGTPDPGAVAMAAMFTAAAAAL
jgi:dihydroxyacetone kinase